MITVGMNYKVLEGKGDLFESVFNKVLGIMNNMGGHKQSFLYKDTNDSCAYLIISEWSDRSAFDGFIASDQFKGVVNWGKEEVLAGRPKHEIYETGAGHEPAEVDGRCPVSHS